MMGLNGPPPRSELNRNVPVSPPPPAFKGPREDKPKKKKKKGDDGDGFVAGVVTGAILF